MSLVTVPAVLLRSYPYSETSLILRFLTPEFGVVSALARGVRRRSSRGQTPLETFQRGALTLTYREERDLHGFRDFESSSTALRFAADLLRFGGASFLAELVLTHTMQEANPGLFADLVGALDRIEVAPQEALPGVILSGAWTLLVDFGFPPTLGECVECGRELPGRGIGRFDLEGGGVRCLGCADRGTGPRIRPEAQLDLRALVSGNPPETIRGVASHLSLVERYALHHLEARRPFQSTSLLRSSLARLEACDEAGNGPVEHDISPPERKSSA